MTIAERVPNAECELMKTSKSRKTKARVSRKQSAASEPRRANRTGRPAEAAKTKVPPDPQADPMAETWFDPEKALPPHSKLLYANAPSRPAVTTLPPPNRRLRVFAFDPNAGASMATVGINEVTLRIPWESNLDPDPPGEPGIPIAHDLQPGPVGEYLEIIDFDPASGCFYDPVDLNEPSVLGQDGLPPSDGDPQFHQQMVYAVCMNTIANFERAMGRRVMWSPRVLPSGEQASGEQTPQPRDKFVRRLRVYPHGMRMANAFLQLPLE
jgi:hypothetical protein